MDGGIIGKLLIFGKTDSPNQSIDEWIDEQAGTQMKWSLPILSITMPKHPPDIESDMFISETSVHLNEK
jgi:hypothetical protein